MNKAKRTVSILKILIVMLTVIISVFAFGKIYTAQAISESSAEPSEDSVITTSPDDLEPADSDSEKMNLWWLGIVIPLGVILIAVIVLVVIQIYSAINIPFLAKRFKKRNNTKTKN